MYDEPEYAGTRLNGTIVRLLGNGEPVRVTKVGRDLKCTVERLSDSKLFPIPIKELNLKPVPLGYLMLKNTCYYLTRAPLRNDWRQGLRQQQMRFVGEQVNVDQVENIELVRCIQGDYPSYAQAMEQVRLGRKRCAFNREWAMDSARRLWYKGQKVGSYTKDKGPKLGKGYEFLQETLDEVYHVKRKK